MRRRDTRAEHTQDWKLELSFRKAEESTYGHLDMVMGGYFLCGQAPQFQVDSPCFNALLHFSIVSVWKHFKQEEGPSPTFSWSFVDSSTGNPANNSPADNLFPAPARTGSVTRGTCDVWRTAWRRDSWRHPSQVRPHHRQRQRRQCWLFVVTSESASSDVFSMLGLLRKSSH